MSSDMHRRVRLAFVLSSNRHRPLASTRMSVLNMLPYLQRAGYDTSIAFEPEMPSEQPEVCGVADRMLASGVDIVYFQKVRGDSALREVNKLVRAGVTTVYGVCDLVDDEMAEATHLTITVTEYLKELYADRLQHKIRVVHDGIEHPEIHRAYDNVSGTRSRGPLRAVLVTSSTLDTIPVLDPIPKNVKVTVIGRYPHASLLSKARHRLAQARRAWQHAPRKMVLKQVGCRGFHVIDWDPHTVHAIAAQFEIGIIPVDMRDDPLPNMRSVSYWQVKSENRLTMKMALALPVVASPVPSYLPVVRQGQNAYLAGTRSEWLECIEALLDPTVRARVGSQARSDAISRFSKEAQARRLLEALSHATLGGCRGLPARLSTEPAATTLRSRVARNAHHRG